MCFERTDNLRIDPWTACSQTSANSRKSSAWVTVLNWHVLSNQHGHWRMESFHIRQKCLKWFSQYDLEACSVNLELSPKLFICWENHMETLVGRLKVFGCYLASCTRNCLLPYRSDPVESSRTWTNRIFITNHASGYFVLFSWDLV